MPSSILTAAFEQRRGVSTLSEHRDALVLTDVSAAGASIDDRHQQKQDTQPDCIP
jgi:hypothetical protein